MAIYVLYHDPCPSRDGFAAAVAALLKLGDAICPSCDGQGCPTCRDPGTWEATHYIGLSYNDPLPRLPDNSVVYLLDLSRPIEELKEIGMRMSDLIVIDHHKTAIEEIEEYQRQTWWSCTNPKCSHRELIKPKKEWKEDDVQPYCQACCKPDKIRAFGQLAMAELEDTGEHPELPGTYILDREHSGAVLAWMHFHPNTHIPWPFLYIEDYDLWKFELQRSRETNARLQSIPKEFSRWEALINNWSVEGSYRVAAMGKAILEAQQAQMELIERNVQIIPDPTSSRRPCRSWAVVNSSSYQSNLGQFILDTHLEVDIALIWHERFDGRIKSSLRSRNTGGPDVGAIAKSIGGGGHEHAAGVTTDSQWWSYSAYRKALAWQSSLTS